MNPTAANLRQIVLLTYLSRSGSTFLAGLLDACDALSVSLESTLPDGILRPEVQLRHDDDVPRLVDALEHDPKFAAWTVDRETLLARLRQLPRPAGYDAVLEAVLSTALPGARTAVYKAGAYVHHLSLVHAKLPSAKVVHVMRDPRAVYASQRRSVSSIDNRPMSDNPLIFAFAARRAMEQVHLHREASWLYIVRYEQLVRGPREEVGKLLAWLGHGDGKDLELADSYADRIPESQAHLHRNVAGPANAARVDAWRKELPPTDLALLQSALGDLLQREGYDLVDTVPLGCIDRVRIFRMRLAAAVFNGARRLRWAWEDVKIRRG